MTFEAFKAGDHIRHFARMRKWELGRWNVIVEGESDVEYFNLASDLYHTETGLRLVGRDLAILCAGEGEAGGTSGVVRELTLFNGLANSDTLPSGKHVFRFGALLDGDSEGRKAAHHLTARLTELELWRHVFLLERVLPRETQDPSKLTALVRERNAEWRNLGACVIEDLLPTYLLDLFLEEYPNSLRRSPPKKIGTGHHYDFNSGGKSKLRRWVRENASAPEMGGLVETLKSLRYYAGFNPDGV